MDSFRDKISTHEDQIFGITLFFAGIKRLYGDNKDLMDANQRSFEAVITRAKKTVEDAKKLLHAVEADPQKRPFLESFEFPSIHGHPMLDQMATRAKILVETYNDLFPGRDREQPLSDTEHLLLMQEASRRF